MSFFKELKEDLAQAVDELLPEEQEEMTSGEDTEASYEDDQMVNTLDMSDTSETAAAEEDEDGFDLSGEDEDEEALLLEQMMREEEEEKAAAKASAETKVSAEPKASAAVKEEEPAASLTGEAKSDVTVITKGTVINGSIISDGSLDVMGTITGDIECLGKLSIMGTVKGNSTASEIYVNTPRLEGDILSQGSVKVSVGTVVVGDITASSSVIAGAVKGEIDVNGPVIVDSTAVVKGNINAKAVQINNGAVVEGFCSLSYASVDIDTFFDAEEE